MQNLEFDTNDYTFNDKIRKKYLELEQFLSQPNIRYIAEGLVILAFFSFVLFPALNLLISVMTHWSEIYSITFADPILKDTVWRSMISSILLSFRIATIVTFIDILIGIPIAYVLARYEFTGKRFLDTLIDVPLAVPTSALGFSIFLFWGTNQGLSFLWNGSTGVFEQGPMLLVLGHVAFSFPYVVRNLKGVIENVSLEIEYAGRTLGAPPLTVFRFLTAPLAKEGIIAGAILAFTRSLGETGASLLLAGVYQTAPIQIVTFMNSYRIPQTAFLSLILIVISVSLLVGVRQYARKVGLPQPKVFPEFERKLSSKKVVNTRNYISFALFFFLVFIPALFVVVYLITVFNGNPYTGDRMGGAIYQVFQAPDRKWQSMQVALLVSLEVALITTIVNLLLGVPMAYLLVKRPYWGRWRTVLDALIDVPLVIPSSALGFSVFYLWGGLGLGLVSPGLWMIVLAHLTFTYPFTVRPMISYIENLPPMYQEAGTTLGGSDLTVFRRVTIPILKKGILASAIMTFTRSMSETGATIIVMGNTRSIPVYIVDLVEAEALPAAAFAATILVILSFIMLMILRYLSPEGKTD